MLQESKFCVLANKLGFFIRIQEETFVFCQHPMSIADQLEELIPGYSANPASGESYDRENGTLVGDPDQRVWFFAERSQGLSCLSWLAFIEHNISRDDFSAIIRWAHEIYG
jgi:hypothetical protein